MAKIFKVPFAATGDKTVVPIPTQPDGSVSWTQGYGFDYQRKLDGSDPLAKPYPRNQHNQILNDITTALGEIQVNGAALWSSEGTPYPVNAKVRHNGINYISKISNNNSTPSDGSSWGIDGYTPIASESVTGIVKLATPAEMDSLTNRSDAVSPANLNTWFGGAGRRATELLRGIIAIATSAQAVAGSNDDTAMTPAKVAAWWTAKKPTLVATETVTGLVKYAAASQMNDPLNSTDVVTPSKLIAWINGVGMAASETQAGIIALATNAQAIAGSNTLNAMTPAKVTAWWSNILSGLGATESLAGVARISSSAQALAGTDDTTIMTPRKVASRIATETSIGQSSIASLAVALQGTNDASIITPNKLTAVLAAWFPNKVFATNDYIRIPDKPGGLIIQWGKTAAFSDPGSVVVTLPTPFPSARMVFGGTNAETISTGTASAECNINLVTASTVRIEYNSTISAASSVVNWIAIGN